jgi:hypothetical protein
MKKIGKNSVRKVLCTIALLLSLWMPFKIPIAKAAICFGSTCTGLYPDPGTGCTADWSSSYYYSGEAKFEGRSSPESGSGACDAGWTRVYNNSSGYRYVAGSTRYGDGGRYYYLDQSVESGGWPPYSQSIGPGQYVYTPMVGPDSTRDLIPCGAASSSIITLPLGGTYPELNSACGYVF